MSASEAIARCRRLEVLPWDDVAIQHEITGATAAQRVAFGRQTGVPAVLNTSFNLKGEPVVCSPLDALRTFVASGMDVLVLGNLLVRKSSFRRGVQEGVHVHA